MKFSICGFGILLLPCLLGAQEGSAVRVTEVASTLGHADYPFGTINDMLALPDGRVLVADDSSPALWIWDTSSGGVQRLAREGEGPGEVRTPTQLAGRPGGGFALYDAGHAAILLFSGSLDFERIIRVGLVSNPKDLLVLRDGTFILAGGRLRETTHLQRYSVEGSRLEVWGNLPPGLTDPSVVVQSAGGALRNTQDGRWLFASAAPYRIFEFPAPDLSNPSILTEDLELVSTPTDEGLVQRLENGRRAFRWWFDRITGVIELSEGRLLTVVTRFYEGDSVWSIHGPEGALTKRTVVERAYHLHDRLDEDTFVGSYRDPDTDERIAVILDVSGIR